MIVLLVADNCVFAYDVFKLDGEFHAEPIQCDAPVAAVREMIADHDGRIPTPQQRGVVSRRLRKSRVEPTMNKETP